MTPYLPGHPHLPDLNQTAAPQFWTNGVYTNPPPHKPWWALTAGSKDCMFWLESAIVAR